MKQINISGVHDTCKTVTDIPVIKSQKEPTHKHKQYNLLALWDHLRSH